MRSIDRAAFAALVVRHRRLAIGVARRQLGDPARAEETAQEAFLVAWERLADLRDPLAFTAWLLQIVRSVCARTRRRERLVTGPLSDAADEGPDARDRLEGARRLAAARVALGKLPSRQRQVAVLHYLDGHSIAEISAMLRVAEPTLAKRLHDARAGLRRVVAGNAPFVLPVAPRVVPCPAPPGQPVLPSTRAWYLAEDPRSRRVLGHAALAATPFRPIYRMAIAGDLQRGAGDALWSRLSEDLTAANATAVWLRAPADLTDLLTWLGGLGFAETDRRWELRHRQARPIRPCPGVTIASLADERRRDPDFVARLGALLCELRRADPTRPFARLPHETVERWLRTGALALDTGFVARRGERYLGHVDLRPQEAAGGALAVTALGVLPEEQSGGVGAALLDVAVAAARAHGVRGVRAFARSVDETSLALHERAGFVRVIPHVTLERCLRPTVAADPRILDGYRGRYRLEWGDVTMTRHREVLVSQVADRVDHWLAGPDGWFFVKEHYGQIRFERDAGGRAVRLRYREGDRESVGARVD